LEQLLAGLGDGHLRGRTAEAEGGELRQLLAHGSAHRLIRTWVRLRTSASPDFTVMSMRAVPTAASTAPTVAVSLSEVRSEEHTSELQSRFDLVCRLLL